MNEQLVTNLQVLQRLRLQEKVPALCKGSIEETTQRNK